MQIANTRVLGSSAINETRFQFDRGNISSVSDDSSPQIDALNSFIGGGAQVGNSLNALNSFEFQNYTTISRETH
ncbi:MAG TPA: hypothetical protein VNE63_13965, partial [Candidatus Acidoferrales bacterium]|nr:hypothetical protein [Candidatus Acidoferrales bacterium]